VIGAVRDPGISRRDRFLQGAVASCAFRMRDGLINKIASRPQLFIDQSTAQADAGGGGIRVY